jgi:hypothetical protein
MQGKSKSGERTVLISMQDKEKEYLRGHVIDGRNLFPAMAYIVSCSVQCLTHVVMGLPCIDVTVFIFTSHIKKGCNYSN